MAAESEYARITGTEIPHEVHGAFPPFDQAHFAPQLIWLALIFGTLYLLMSKVALPRIEDILQTRSSKINGDLSEATAMREQAEEAATAHAKTLADAKAQALALAQETHKRLAAETDAKRHSLETELANKLGAAEAQITEMKTKAMTNVEGIAREAAAAIVHHLTGKPADEAKIAAAFAPKNS